MAKSTEWSNYDESIGSTDSYWPPGGFQGTTPIATSQAGNVFGSSSNVPTHAYSPHHVAGLPGMVGSMGPAYPSPAPSNAVQQPQMVPVDLQPQMVPTDWQRQQLSHMQPAVVSRNGDAAIIIWDWDDTLMCSSAINSNQLQLHQTQQLELLLEQVLTYSMRLGETAIVTNADELWVLESTRRFAPRVLPLLSQISVVSARRKYERSCPGDVFAWKRETFREVLAQRKIGCVNGATSLNLVVLGDSPAEMEAAQTATVGLMIPMTIKTVKFKESPSADEILEQLRIVIQELSTIVADDKSGCRNLVQWMRPQFAAAAPQAALTYTPGPVTSASFAYNPPLLPAPYAAPQSAYLGAPMIYATGQ